MAFQPLQGWLAGALPQSLGVPSKEPKAPCQDTRLRANAPVFIPRGLSLPAVVSVRKSASKGCAVVLLRDVDVLERSVQQRVAVVDRVCVEVKRHVRKEREVAPEDDSGEATPTTASSSREASPSSGDEVVGGVFVAWGHRVERRMPVSEEGLEAYFNGLAGTRAPKELEVKKPFEEQLQRFPLSSHGPLALNMEPKQDSATADRLLESPHSNKELVQGLWRAKETLDSLWAKPPPPMGRNLCQRVARDQLFPCSGKEGREGREHENRAGEKLAELADAAGLLEGVPEGAGFLDLCGGPGAWSQFLLAHRALDLRGFGFTLRSKQGSAQDWQAQEKDDWYPELFEEPNWQAIWGADGTGDLLKPGNLEHSASKLREAGGVFLCVADGGFSDQAIPANLLELYFYRLLLAELLMAASCLRPGGRFVCKLYSAYSSHTAGLLFLATRLFESVAVVKPKSSRVAGPERYLVAFGFRGETSEVEEVRRALAQSHRAGGGRGVLELPLLEPAVAPKALAAEEEFLSGLRTMVGSLCRRQTLALTSILERAELLEDVALEAAASSAASGPPRREGWEVAARSPQASPSPVHRDFEHKPRHQREQGRGRGERDGGKDQRGAPRQQRGGGGRAEGRPVAAGARGGAAAGGKGKWGGKPRGQQARQAAEREASALLFAEAEAKAER